MIISDKTLSELEVKRARLHQYVLDKLEERDYHAVQDAGSDLREIEVKVSILDQILIEKYKSEYKKENN